MEAFLLNLHISHALSYDNQKVVEQIKKDIMAISKWADVAVSVIAISED